MNLLVFGATGGTGRQVVIQALARGDTVTAFVRDPLGLPSGETRLRIVTGDATSDEKQIAHALAGQDAVVSALGRGKVLEADRLISQSTRLMVRAMDRAGVRRLVVVSAFGVGASRDEAPLIPRIMHRVLLKDIFADKAAGEVEVRHSNLDWTVVYPVQLTNGPITGRYRVGERLKLSGIPKVSRADVAHFILRELNEPAFIRKIAVVSN